MLTLIPRDKFDQLVSRHAFDKHQKGINLEKCSLGCSRSPYCSVRSAMRLPYGISVLASTTGNLSYRLKSCALPIKRDMKIKSYVVTLRKRSIDSDPDSNDRRASTRIPLRDSGLQVAPIQYGCPARSHIYKIVSICKDPPDRLFERSVLHADEGFRKRAIAYKV